MAKVDFILDDIKGRYPMSKANEAYARLYEDEDARLASMFAEFHHRLNGQFDTLNYRLSYGHYLAADSREFIALIGEIRSVQKDFKRVGIDVSLSPAYERLLEECNDFLSPSGGSPIPEGYGPVDIERYEPVFTTATTSIQLATKDRRAKLTLVGEGSYAHVHKYLDDEYGVHIARKRARVTLDAKELQRFRQEYDTLRSLNFPYILQAYVYNDADNSFTMEYCDSTLDDFISRHNATMSQATRKRVALQFLYGMNYLHAKKVFHRDISRRNVLVKVYDMGAVVVKISDFGLHKAESSELTSTGSSMKGTIRDPTLSTLKDFDVMAEIYAVGAILSFVFSGKDNLGACDGELGEIIKKCTDLDRAARYQSVKEVIAAVESLDMTGAATETPA